MKLTDEIKIDRLIKVAEQRDRSQIMKQMIPQPGQKLYELDVATDTITVIDHKTATSITLPTKKTDIPIIHNKLTAKATCLYVLAINERNAIKKFIKMLS